MDRTGGGDGSKAVKYDRFDPIVCCCPQYHVLRTDGCACPELCYAGFAYPCAFAYPCFWWCLCWYHNTYLKK